MRYQLRLRVEISQLGEHGEYLGGTNNLQVTEDIQFEASNFLEVAHTLAENIKKST